MTAVDDRRAAMLRRRLADELAVNGDLRSPEWRRAVEAVPRHVFVPDFFRRIDTPAETLWEPVSPSRVGAGEWLELAYSNETWVTQLDRCVSPSEVGEPVAGTPTSSSSMPGLVVLMLEELQIDDGMRVLEIGTGTGYSTALLSYRLGGEFVTSVDIDASVTRRASGALCAAGYPPELAAADGLGGYARNARYDRLIATCSVRHVPPAWIAQTRPGGLILTTLSGWLDGSSGLTRVQVTGEGTAEGHFLPGTISFMPARPHDHPELPIGVPVLDEQDGYERVTTVGPDVLDPGNWTPLFIAQLAAPFVQSFAVSIDGGPLTHYLIDSQNDAVAALRTQRDGTHTVRQSGPLALWDQVEEAMTAWRTAGSPAIDQFRISITPERQRIWLDAPNGPSWDLPL